MSLTVLCPVSRSCNMRNRSGSPSSLNRRATSSSIFSLNCSLAERIMIILPYCHILWQEIQMNSPLPPADAVLPQEAQSSQRPANRRRWLRPVLLATVVFLIIGRYSNHWLSLSGARTDAAHRQRVPDFDFSEWGGGHWRLSDHRGQVVLITSGQRGVHRAARKRRGWSIWPRRCCQR